MATGVAAPAPIAIVTGPMALPLAGASIPGPTSPAWAIAGAGPGAGSPGAWVAPHVETVASLGALAPEHDGQWFDRVHVIPRRVDLGFMSGNRQVQVEVWNAWRRGRTLSAVDITGPVGVSVQGSAVPQQFAGLQSKVFLVDVSVLEGFPVDNVIAWVFTGVSAEGTTLVLTGQRLVLLSASPNAEDAVEESYGYMTDLMQAWDGTEQRVLLRAIASRELRFRVTLATAREAGDVATRLYAGGRGLFSVPLWQDAAPLTAPAAPGATSVYLETAGRAFAEGGVCVLWRDHWTWEPATIQSVAADHLVLDSGIAGAWAAPAVCVPLLTARLLDAVPLERVAPAVADVSVAFAQEAV